MMSLHAENWEDARSRLKALRKTGSVEGRFPTDKELRTGIAEKVLQERGKRRKSRKSSSGSSRKSSSDTRQAVRSVLNKDPGKQADARRIVHTLLHGRGEGSEPVKKEEREWGEWE